MQSPLGRPYRPGDENRIDQVDERALQLAFRVLELPRRYFRYEVSGLDNLSEGPALIVSPHSFISVDGFLLARAIYERTGRLARGLSDHSLFSIPGVRRVLLRLGIVDGNRDNAIRLLKRGELCFAMPGGAFEAWKPSRDRYRIFWEGHHGFVAVAIAARAPVVPSVCLGSDDAFYLPVHGLELGQRLFRRRIPIPLAVGPLGLLPVPFPVHFRALVGEPIELDAEPQDADNPRVVKRCHERVVGAIEAMLAELRR